MTIQLNKALLATALVFSMTAAVQATDQGHGKVTFNGAVVDSPCSISPSSIDQTVDLGQISSAALKDGGKSTPRNFTIGLENCSFGDDSATAKNKVQLTFSGMESQAQNGLLGVTGTSSGASVAITDGSGALIKLGQASALQKLQDGNNTLTFAAYLQGDGASSVVSEGNFQAVTDFTLAYN